MRYIFAVEDIEIIITKKKIKNIHLRVNQEGKVTLSCPSKTSEIVIEEFIQSKLLWIKSSIKKFDSKTKFSNKNFLEGEIHYIFGNEVKLTHRIDSLIKDKVYLENNTNLILNLSPYISNKTKERHLNKWYEQELFKESEKYFVKWEEILNVKKNSLIIKKMKGKWGYCDCRKEIICLNTELAKRNREFIEYVVLHELCHLLVPNHSQKFKDLLNLHMPEWKLISKNQ